MKRIKKSPKYPPPGVKVGPPVCMAQRPVQQLEAVLHLPVPWPPRVGEGLQVLLLQVRHTRRGWKAMGDNEKPAAAGG